MLVTPTYHVFDLYKVHQDAKLLSTKFDSPDYSYAGIKIPALNVSASRDATGAVHISLVNLDPFKRIIIKTSLEHLPSNMISGKILSSEKFTDINTFAKPDYVHITAFNGIKKKGNNLLIELPAKSVVVIELK